MLFYLVVSVEVEILCLGHVVVEAEVNLVSVRGPRPEFHLNNFIIYLSFTYSNKMRKDIAILPPPPHTHP